jgi:hypothetical protein
MTAIKSQHTRSFERLAREYQDSLIASLAAGVPSDYATYRQIVGELQGVANALRLSEQADFELSGDEPNVGA